MLKRVREQIPPQPLKEPVERMQQRVTSCACVRETAPCELPSLLLGFLPIKTPFKRSPSFSVCPVGICSYFFVSLPPPISRHRAGLLTYFLTSLEFFFSLSLPCCAPNYFYIFLGLCNSLTVVLLSHICLFSIFFTS